VSLEQLWAGWRASYVASVTDPLERVPAGGPELASATDPAKARSGEGCVFCRILAAPSSDEERRVIHVGPRVSALLNAYPYASGHLLVLPRRHVASLSELEGDESAELWATATMAVEALEGAYRPDGVNLGANLGRAAGAGIPTHLHLHVVPRWLGDTNFMTSIAETRVLPEPLGVSWAKLRGAWPR